MKIKITENSNFNQTEKIIDLLDVKRNISKKFSQIGKELVKHSRSEMFASKNGIKYSSLPNKSSQTGEALASQTGDSSRSIKYILNGSRYLDFGGNTPQLAIWEGDSNSKYNNRPTLLNSVEKFDSILKERLSK